MQEPGAGNWIPLHQIFAPLALIVLLLVGIQTSQAQTVVGPLPYLSAADSPFPIYGEQFHLEDFEDGAFEPGFLVSGYRLCETPLCYADSVDADDGLIDGSGSDGISACLGPACGSSTQYGTFFFQPNSLGFFPTHVGVVWTDGLNFQSTLGPFDVKFEWYDANSTHLGAYTVKSPGDDSFEGETAEDFFIGMIHKPGISRLTITISGFVNYTEIDHLQYGIESPLRLKLPLGVMCGNKPCTPYTVKLSAIIDHSGTPLDQESNNTWYGKDDIVLAYTGERGEKIYGWDGSSSPGFKNSQGTDFKINGNYVGTSSTGSEFLQYDGHPGYDFPYPAGTPIIAPASGRLFKATEDTVNHNSSCALNGWEEWHSFYIEHEQGFTTWYLHASDLHATIKDEIAKFGSALVEQGQVVALVGNFGACSSVGTHLHFEVRRGLSQVVEPYTEDLWEESSEICFPIKAPATGKITIICL